MQILPEQDDNPQFAAEVQELASGLLHTYAPPALILIKINRWFGPRWLHFAGKVIGLLGVWREDPAIIPPFVPNRVVSERRFSAPEYSEVDAGQSIHLKIPAIEGVLRRSSQVARGSAILWYSGESKTSAQGSVMAHIPVAGIYSCWYAGFSMADANQSPRASNVLNISLQELSNLRNSGLHNSGSVEGNSDLIETKLF